MHFPAASRELPVAADAPVPRRRHTLPGTLSAGVALTAILAIAAVAGSWLVPYNPDQLNVPDALQPPDARHWFGTDQYGRDIFSRVVVAARTDLLIALSIVGIALVAGTIVGIVAGYDPDDGPRDQCDPDDGQRDQQVCPGRDDDSGEDVPPVLVSAEPVPGIWRLQRVWDVELVGVVRDKPGPGDGSDSQDCGERNSGTEGAGQRVPPPGNWRVRGDGQLPRGRREMHGYRTTTRGSSPAYSKSAAMLTSTTNTAKTRTKPCTT